MSPLLVGREHECAALRAHLANSGRVILVSGEAGAGKTTLVEHVLAGTTTWRGQAGEWAGAAYDILARALRSVAPVDGVLARMRPDSVAVLGSVLTGAAAGRGAVLFLDDLQWADDASLDLLPALADVLSGSTVAVVGCYRSDELPRDHRLRVVRALLRRKRQLAEVTVGRLPEDAVQRMLGLLLGADPERAMVAAVDRRSDGLPFAVEELALRATWMAAVWPIATAWSGCPAARTLPCPTASGKRCCCALRGSLTRDARSSRPQRCPARSSTSTWCSRRPASQPGQTDSPARACWPRLPTAGLPSGMR